ncbi:WXG100 family type VII secretion target [Clostridium gasigenes]|uniref:ESAT-6-like protein n=1 Tax=Clostridium gasigenes TaxID=94869 RepID=A0A7X0SFH4_9CLOT|nr:WXG100 family type VII secretion target [Clostridium gasigenes]
MPDVLVNKNKLNEAKVVYRNYANELKHTISNLNNAVEKIESQWKGASKDSFKNSHFPKVHKSMNEHNKKIECLAKELEYISEQFTELEKEIIRKTT